MKVWKEFFLISESRPWDTRMALKVIDSSLKSRARLLVFVQKAYLTKM